MKEMKFKFREGWRTSYIEIGVNADGNVYVGTIYCPKSHTNSQIVHHLGVRSDQLYFYKNPYESLNSYYEFDELKQLIYGNKV